MQTIKHNHTSVYHELRAVNPHPYIYASRAVHGHGRPAANYVLRLTTLQFRAVDSGEKSEAIQIEVKVSQDYESGRTCSMYGDCHMSREQFEKIARHLGYDLVYLGTDVTT